MSLMTNWGYSLTDELPDIITPAEFNVYTANKFSGDMRILSEIRAASNAARNYCGWHIYPSMSCKMTERVLYGDGRIKFVGRDLMIQLPAKYVTSISSVKINDTGHTDIGHETDGILYVFDVDPIRINRKTQITVEYTAGVPAALMQSIKEIIVHRVTHALSSSYGVASESAGGVSISYSQNWINSTRASALPDDNKEVLSYYRLQGVF